MMRMVVQRTILELKSGGDMRNLHTHLSGFNALSRLESSPSSPYYLILILVKILSLGYQVAIEITP